MKLTIKSIAVAGVFTFLLGGANAAEIINNGGFSAGLTGWTKADQTGSDGTFSVQTGTVSPLTGTPVPAPAGAPNAAMTDAQGPGSHVLYQDFVVTAPVASAVLSFNLFLGNQATAFYLPSPASLDFSLAAFNQQARVDLMLGSASAFSVNASDILFNAFQTNPATTGGSGYTAYSVQIASLLNANLNRTLRLRFAETDNVAPFLFGVDNVSLDTSAAPEPSSLVMGGIGVLAGLGYSLRRRWQNSR